MRQGVGHARGLEIVLYKLGHDASPRHDVDEPDVGDGHGAAGQCVSLDGAGAKGEHQRTAGDGRFQGGRAALAHRGIGGTEHGE